MIEKPLAWHFTGKVYDRGGNLEPCAICGRPARFLFQVSPINNNQKTALVGSECANKTSNPFAVTEALDLDIWMLKHKTRLYSEARSRRLIHLLLKIKETDKKHDVSGLLATCKKHARFTPRQAMYFASIVKLNNMTVSPDIIPVSLAKTSDKEQVKTMKDWEFQRLYEALSPRQQTICKKSRLGLDD